MQSAGPGGGIRHDVRAASMSEGPLDQGESLEDIATFLSGVEAFKTLDREQLSRVAAAVTHRGLRAGEALIVEGGHPSTQLWVLRDGALDLLRRDRLVTVMTTGELLGYASLLTRTAPAFSVRARVDCTLYCIPGELGIELLSREDGVRWLATTQRDALLYAARSLSPLPEVQTLPVTAVMRGVPQLCDPEMTISEAAELMTARGRSAILVRARGGLGIVTDVDLREKVVVGGVSRDAPVSAIMSAPVHTIRSDTFAAEASIAMLTLGVSHLPVLDDGGTVVGMVSAGDLMSLEARNPFALRRAVHRARDEDELVAAAGDIPKLFVDLLDARLDAPVLCRVLTILHDALTVRLLELAFERHGAPPVDYAWLVFGSAAHHRGHRQRLHLRKRAQGARRIEQRVALGRRQPAHAVLTAEQLDAEIAGDAVERAVDAGPHREGRRGAGEQACVAEELAGRHHGDQVVPAQKVEGAVAKHPELRAGMATLDDHRLAGAQVAVRHRGRDPRQLVAAQRSERLDAGQKGRDVVEALALVDRSLAHGRSTNVVPDASTMACELRLMASSLTVPGAPSTTTPHAGPILPPAPNDGHHPEGAFPADAGEREACSCGMWPSRGYGHYEVRKLTYILPATRTARPGIPGGPS